MTVNGFTAPNDNTIRAIDDDSNPRANQIPRVFDLVSSAPMLAAFRGEDKPVLTWFKAHVSVSSEAAGQLDRTYPLPGGGELRQDPTVRTRFVVSKGDRNPYIEADGGAMTTTSQSLERTLDGINSLALPVELPDMVIVEWVVRETAPTVLPCEYIYHAQSRRGNYSGMIGRALGFDVTNRSTYIRDKLKAEGFIQAGETDWLSQRARSTLITDWLTYDGGKDHFDLQTAGLLGEVVESFSEGFPWVEGGEPVPIEAPDAGLQGRLYRLENGSIVVA